MKFQFENLQDFIHMHGHGPYVWAAYAITLVAIGYLLAAPLLDARAFFKQQRKLQTLAQQQQQN